MHSNASTAIEKEIHLLAVQKLYNVAIAKPTPVEAEEAIVVDA
jgi:hypothetical protein